MTSLLPCPFCGDAGEIMQCDYNPTFFSYQHYCRCSNTDCVAHYEPDGEFDNCSVQFDSAEEAAQAWNTRVSDPMDEIHTLLDGTEWDSDTTAAVASVLTKYGYYVGDRDANH